jgi:hypothetical protein
MLESVLAEIDAEIARLQAARKLLSSPGGAGAVRRSSYPIAATLGKVPKRRNLSAEARERIRQAQIKRWAAAKKAAKPKANLNATVAPLPKAKKKAAKSAA